jgi:DNA-binding PadR family transcriptional regulator
MGVTRKSRQRGGSAETLLGSYSDPAVLILTSLADGPKHGYGLIKDIERFAGVSLGAGTLYGAIRRLEGDGLIRPLPAEDRRQPYEITATGASALASHVKTMAQVASVTTSRLGALGLT